MHYTSHEKKTYCRVVLASPKLVATLRSVIESSPLVENPATGEGVRIPPDVFEANIPFELRFMTDTAMVGCSWVEGNGSAV